MSARGARESAFFAALFRAPCPQVSESAADFVLCSPAFPHPVVLGLGKAHTRDHAALSLRERQAEFETADRLAAACEDAGVRLDASCFWSWRLFSVILGAYRPEGSL